MFLVFTCCKGNIRATLVEGSETSFCGTGVDEGRKQEDVGISDGQKNGTAALSRGTCLSLSRAPASYVLSTCRSSSLGNISLIS